MVDLAAANIDNLDSLEEACKDLGFKLDREQKKAQFYGSQTEACDATISVPGTSYQVAVKQNEKSGKYKLRGDFYDSRLRTACGEKAGKILQRYAVAEAKRIARRKNYTVREIALPGGRIQLKIKPRI